MGFFKNAFWIVLVSVALVNLPSLFVSGPPKYLGDGFAAPGWERVIQVFRDNVENGLEKGGAFAVYYQGQLVVNYAGGYADVEAEWKWDVNTLCQIFSSTKGVVAVMMAMLVDRGLLEYAKPVADYWPEFAQNGKGGITVEQLLSHKAGLAAIDEPISGLGDPGDRASSLAKQNPNWTPGELHGYHGLTIGLYEDEILKRVDPKHREVRQFFQEEVADKYGIDLQISLRSSDFYRTARVYSGSLSLRELPGLLIDGAGLWNLIYTLNTNPQSVTHRAFTNPIEFAMSKPKSPNHPEYKKMTNPSVMGYTSAEGLAKFWSLVASKRLVSRDVMKKLTETLAQGYDHVLLFNTTFGRGLSPVPPPGDRDGITTGASGAGGQMGYADPGRDLAWGYVTNHHLMRKGGDDPRYHALISATYQVVDELQEIRPVYEPVLD